MVRLVFVTCVKFSSVVHIIVHFSYPRMMINDPTFVAKITECLFSRWFFNQISFDFLISLVEGVSLKSFKKYCCPELKFETYFI